MPQVLPKRYLDLSTAHLTPETTALLQDYADAILPDGWPALTVAKYPEGFFVSIPPNIYGMPQDITEAMDLGALKTCEALRFDADGEKVEALTDYTPVAP
jgi:hypothetical protein